jgi:hypothetical protein
VNLINKNFKIMKHYLSYLSTIVLFALISICTVNAQTSKGDTLFITTVEAMEIPLNEIIAGDTTASGDRQHKVYELEPDGWYSLSGTLNTSSYDLNLVSSKRTSTDQMRPILLFKEEFAGWALIESGKNVYLEGLHIMEAAETEGGNLGPWARAGLNLWPAGENQAVTMHDMVLDFSHSMWLAGAKNGLKLTLTNNLVRFRGGVNNDWWNGFAFVPNNIKDIEVYVENCTFYQSHFIAFNFGETIQKSLIIKNCTFVDNTHHLFVGKEWMNAEFSNNLFVNAFTNGETIGLRSGRDIDMPYGVINLDTMYYEIIQINDTTTALGNPLLEEEATRIVKVLNNNNYVNPKIKEFWQWAMNYDGSSDNDSVKYYDQYLVADPDFYDGFMNSRAQGMFANKDAYPNLSIENTTSLDPGFIDYPDFSDEMIMWAKVMYGPEGAADVKENYMPKIFQDPDGNVLMPTDPMVYNLKYTNTTLLQAATDGGPIGDRTWFLENGYNNIDVAKAAELKFNTNAVSIFNQIDKFLNVYPNPVTGNFINIDGTENEAKIIYNVSGSVVLTSNENSIDISKLNSGIYIIKSGDKTSRFIKQ